MALTWSMTIKRDAEGKATKVVGVTRIAGKPARMEVTQTRVRLTVTGQIQAETPNELVEFAQVATDMQRDMTAQFAPGGQAMARRADEKD